MRLAGARCSSRQTSVFARSKWLRSFETNQRSRSSARVTATWSRSSTSGCTKRSHWMGSCSEGRVQPGCGQFRIVRLWRAVCCNDFRTRCHRIHGVLHMVLHHGQDVGSNDPRGTWPWCLHVVHYWITSTAPLLEMDGKLAVLDELNARAHLYAEPGAEFSSAPGPNLRSQALLSSSDRYLEADTWGLARLRCGVWTETSIS